MEYAHTRQEAFIRILRGCMCPCLNSLECFVCIVCCFDGLSPMWPGTRPIMTRMVKAPATKPTAPTGNLQKLPICDKCGNGIV